MGKISVLSVDFNYLIFSNILLPSIQLFLVNKLFDIRCLTNWPFNLFLLNLSILFFMHTVLPMVLCLIDYMGKVMIAL